VAIFKISQHFPGGTTENVRQDSQSLGRRIKIWHLPNTKQDCQRLKRPYKTLIGKSEGKRPLGTNKSTQEDNIKLDFKEIACLNANCIHLDQIGFSEHNDEPPVSIKCG
jgi:hypothetical protein